MCRASVDKDRVGRLRIALSAISLQDLNLIEMSEIVTRTRGEVWIYLDARDMTVRPNYFGDNRGVVTAAASAAKATISRCEFDPVKPRGEGTRWPVIES